MDKTKIAIIAVAVCAAVLLTGLTVMSFSSNDPLAMIGKALEKSVAAAEKSDFAKYSDEVLNGGSIELAGNAKDITAASLGLGIDLDLSAKTYFDLKNAKLAATVNASFDEEELVSAQVYGDEKMIAVMCDALLGDTAYGVNLEKFTENFENSEFGEDGAYSIGVTMEDVETYLETLESNEKMTKDAEKVIEKLMKAVSKSIKEHAEIEKVGGSIRIGGEDINTNDIIITADGEAIVLICTDVLEYVADDKNLRNFLEDNAESIFSSFYVSEGDEIDTDDMIDEFYDAVDEALDSIETYEDEIEDASVMFTANIGKSNGQLIGAELEAEYDGESIAEVSFVCGPTWKEITELTVKAEIEGEKYTVSMEVEEDTKEAYETVVKVKYDSETLFRADIAWDKEDGDFEFSAEQSGYVLFELEGELVQSGKVSTLTFDKLRTAYSEMDLGGICIIVNESDKMPKINSYKDVLTMSEDDIAEVITTVEDAVAELASSFGMGSLGGLGGLGGADDESWGEDMEIPSDGSLGW